MKYFKITDPFKFATEKMGRKEELKQPETVL